MLKNLCYKLLIHEQRLQCFKGLDPPSLSHALVAQNSNSNSSNTTPLY